MCWAWDRGRGGQAAGYRFQGAFNRFLPFGRGKAIGTDMPRVLNAIFGNWEISGNMRFRSGVPMNVTYTGAGPSSTDTFWGRPDVIGDWWLGEAQNPDHGINEKAFEIPALCPSTNRTGTRGAGRYGNAGRNVIDGPAPGYIPGITGAPSSYDRSGMRIFFFNLALEF